jgi:hypothetical protein
MKILLIEDHKAARKMLAPANHLGARPSRNSTRDNPYHPIWQVYRIWPSE